MMLSIHPRNGVSKTPDAAKAALSALTTLDPAFAELQPLVEGMSAEGRKRAIVHIDGFLKARASYDATMRRLGLDDSPDAA